MNSNSQLILNNSYKSKTYHLRCSYHLGDNVFNLILLYIIKKYIEKNNIMIFYYAKNEYINQLKEFVCSNNIILKTLNKSPNNSIEVWINNDFFEYTHTLLSNKHAYNKFYINFFNSVLRKMNFNISINKLVYDDNDLLSRYNKFNEKYKNYDILILNSEPLSGQYKEYNKQTWDNYIQKINTQFKILTTTKVNNILCTCDDNLTIKDIASLSIKAKVIIAINSGVVPGLLNYYTLTTVKHFYTFDDRFHYSYPNFENKTNINDITIDELNKYIN